MKITLCKGLELTQGADGHFLHFSAGGKHVGLCIESHKHILGQDVILAWAKDIIQNNPECPKEEQLSKLNKLQGKVKKLQTRLTENNGEEIESTCPKCGSPLEDNGNCSDVGTNNCFYIRGWDD